MGRWFRQRYVRVSGFPLPSSGPHASLRFHLPLIEPNVLRFPYPHRLRILPHRGQTKHNNPAAPIASAAGQKHTGSQRRSARPQPSRTPDRQDGEVSIATRRRNRKTGHWSGDDPFNCLPTPIRVAIDLRESYISFNSDLPNPYLNLSYWRRRCHPAA